MSWFGRLFHRARDVRSEAGRWRRGDLGVCVEDRWYPVCPRSPVKSDVVRVAAVEEASAYGVRSIFLTLDGYSNLRVFDARSFRKIVRNDLPADAAFTREMKRLGERPGPASPEPAPLPVPTDAPAHARAAASGPPASPGDPRP